MSAELMCLSAPRISYCGESALLLDAEGPLSLETQQRIWALCDRLKEWGDVTDIQPGINNLLVLFNRDCDRVPYFKDQLMTLWLKSEPLPVSGKTLEFEVHYGGERGLDLAEVAATHSLSVEEVVRLHTAADYIVVSPGAAPGFGFLFGLHPRLITPRRKSPVQRFQDGAVQIGGAQTSVLGPLHANGAKTAPTGWYVLGFVPDVPPPFDLNKSPFNLVSLGDHIKFRAGRIER